MLKFILGMMLILPCSTLLAGGFGRNVIVSDRFVDEVVIDRKIVEVDADYALGFQGAYDLEQFLREKAERQRAERVEQELNIKTEQIDRLISILEAFLKNKNDCPPEDKPDRPTPTPTPTPTPEPEPEPKPGGGVTILDQRVYDIFEERCFDCHSGDSPKAGIYLGEEGKLAFQNLAQRVNIHDVTYGVGLEERGKKRMPLGPPLSSEEVEIIRLWTVEQAEKQIKEGE